MTKLPSLTNFEKSAPALHQVAQLLGAIRMFVHNPVPNYLELALRLEPNGLSSDTLPAGGKLLLDFEKAAILCTDKVGNEFELPLKRHSQQSLLEAILATLDKQGQGLVSKREGSFVKGFLTALHGKGHTLEGSLQVTANEQLELDPQVSADYIHALYRIFTATSRWRSRLNGPQTPIVVWPEHFDLSTLWFTTDKATESAAHMNFGFAPFDTVHSRPYLYAYAYPMPADFASLPLPNLAHWNTTPWKGMVVPYDKLTQVNDPEAEIERVFEATYNLLLPTLRSLGPAARL